MATGGLSDALAAVAARFRTSTIDGESLRVFSDPSDVNPPCVFLPPPDLTFTYHKGTAEVTWVAFVVAPNAPRQDSQTGWLAALIDAVTGIFPYTSGRVRTLTPPGGAASWQSYELTWSGRITIGGTG